MNSNLPRITINSLIFDLTKKHLHLLKNILFLLAYVILLGCKKEGANQVAISPLQSDVKLKYAKGFSVKNENDLKILNIINPWPNADKTYRYALVDREMASNISLVKEEYDGIILTPVESIIVTSTTHIPALELLGVENKLIGFPGTDYISSKKTRALINNNQIRELGKNEGLNTEVLLSIKPEVVISFGVDGTNKTLNIIQKANIPVIYNGDWTEASPLAKAEWIKFFGVLFNKEEKADSIFNGIESNYKNAKLLASQVKNKPTILSGAMHKDVWYMPNGNSPEAQVLKDANTNYLWAETTGSGSLALNFENVLDKAKDAEFWLSPSYYTSLEQLEKANPHYTKFDAFNNKKVFSFSMTTGETGGVLYYELGMTRPDLVLKDIIKICHPELLSGYQPYFFKPLE